MCRGRIASSPIFLSMMMKDVIPTTPNVYAMNALGDVHPHSRPCSATIRSGTTPTMMVSTPHQSIRLLFDSMCGTCRNERTSSNAIAPIGRFIRKIQRHPVIPRKLSTPASSPPISGPRTLDVPNTARNIPW